MIAARHHTLCPGCDGPIEPGDMIGQIQLAYYCADCFEAWQASVRALPDPVVSYPVSSQYEPGVDCG